MKKLARSVTVTVTAAVAAVMVAGGMAAGGGVAGAGTVISPGAEIRTDRGTCTLGPVLSPVRALTAGHCASVGSAVTTADGVFVGRVVKSVFGGPDSHLPDYAVIDTTDSRVRVSESVNGVPVDWAAVQTRAQLDAVSIEAGGTGSRVCMIGVKTRYACGTIDTVDVDVAGANNDALVRTSIDALPGDSGSPLFLSDGSGTKVSYVGLMASSHGDGGGGSASMLSEVLADCGAVCGRAEMAAVVDRQSVRVITDHGQPRSLWRRIVDALVP